MSRRLRKRGLKEVIDHAQDFCDHRVPHDHEQGHCDYVVITQEELTQILEDARD